MEIQRLVLGMFETNAYIIFNKESRKCILIDPADNADTIIEILREKNLVPEAILLTHGHYDHFLAVKKLQETWSKLPIYCHPFDRPVEKEEYDMGMIFPTISAFSNIVDVEDGENLKIANIDIFVYHTPGHTQGSLMFLANDSLFTGDTLFYRNIGRTDFKGGSVEQMNESLRKIAKIYGDYTVYPGHDGITTLQDEKMHNYYLKRFVE